MVLLSIKMAKTKHYKGSFLFHKCSLQTKLLLCFVNCENFSESISPTSYCMHKTREPHTLGETPDTPQAGRQWGNGAQCTSPVPELDERQLTSLLLQCQFSLWDSASHTYLGAAGELGRLGVWYHRLGAWRLVPTQSLPPGQKQLWPTQETPWRV